MTYLMWLAVAVGVGVFIPALGVIVAGLYGYWLHRRERDRV